jgi:energy-coupling factor transporter ATP-binding protein EcfA2
MTDLPQITLAGVSLPYRMRFPGEKAFAAFAGNRTPEPVPPVCISDSDWEYYRAEGYLENAQVEYSLLTAHFSDALLAYDRVILHAVALRWRDRAYLICGNSGVGKSTQARCLQELRPGEFGIISGDRPVLQFCHSERSAAEPKNPSPVPKPSPLGEGVTASAVTDEGPIIVHPSPWNGKENWHGAPAAPLAGLILLERGDKNRLVALTEREAVLQTYLSFIHTCSEPRIIHRVAALETRLLRAAPIWKLTTDEVPASTELLLESVFARTE